MNLFDARQMISKKDKSKNAHDDFFRMNAKKEMPI